MAELTVATEEADMDMAPVDTVDPTDPIQLDSVFLLVAVAPESTSVSRIQIPIESISKHFGNPRGAFFFEMVPVDQKFPQFTQRVC